MCHRICLWRGMCSARLLPLLLLLYLAYLKLNQAAKQTTDIQRPRWAQLGPPPSPSPPSFFAVLWAKN